MSSEEKESYVSEADEKKRTQEAMVDIRKQWERLRIRKVRYLTFKIVDHVVVLEKKGLKKKNFLDFEKVLPYNEPRYAIYDLEYTTTEAHSRITNIVFFFFWCPTNTNSENRVIYTQQMAPFRGNFPGVQNENIQEWEEIKEFLKTENIDGRGHTIPQDAEKEDEESESDFD